MKTILIVIEDASIRRVLARIVEREGWYVVAADPRRAEQLLGNVRFDVVLSDWFLSTRTAEAMLKALRARHYVGRVIVMSSDTDGDGLRRCAAQGGFRLLPKPFSMASLRKALAETVLDEEPTTPNIPRRTVRAGAALRHASRAFAEARPFARGEEDIKDKPLFPTASSF